MSGRYAAPGEAVAATPRCDEINFGNERIVQRQPGPRHVAELIAGVMRLIVARSLARVQQ